MFKNFNWGHGIFIFYVLFVGAVVSVLIASFSVDHSLVVDDYYAQDLAYQTQYDKTQNSLASENVKINLDETNQELTIDITSAKAIKGTADFYRPSDKSKDFKVELNSAETIIPTDKMLTGKWILKLDWKENGKSFYKEEMIYI